MRWRCCTCSGRRAEAIAHFRESLRLNPDSAPTHYNLGLALSARANTTKRRRISRRHSARSHSRGGAQQSRRDAAAFGRLDEAAAEYRRAFALRPDNAEAHTNLGRLLMLAATVRRGGGRIRAGILSPSRSRLRADRPRLGACDGRRRQFRHPDQAVSPRRTCRQFSNRKDPRASMLWPPPTPQLSNSIRPCRWPRPPSRWPMPWGRHGYGPTSGLGQNCTRRSRPTSQAKRPPCVCSIS